jgi:hypothetical protein
MQFARDRLKSCEPVRRWRKGSALIRLTSQILTQQRLRAFAIADNARKSTISHSMLLGREPINSKWSTDVRFGAHYPRKQTQSGHRTMSGSCQTQTSRMTPLQKRRPPTEASQKKSRPEAASIADQAAIDAAFDFRRYAMKPMPAKPPRSSIAHSLRFRSVACLPSRSACP